jgi:hypothetical protein
MIKALLVTLMILIMPAPLHKAPVFTIARTHSKLLWIGSKSNSKAHWITVQDNIGSDWVIEFIQYE